MCNRICLNCNKLYVQLLCFMNCSVPIGKYEAFASCSYFWVSLFLIPGLVAVHKHILYNFIFLTSLILECHMHMIYMEDQACLNEKQNQTQKYTITTMNKYNYFSYYIIINQVYFSLVKFKLYIIFCYLLIPETAGAIVMVVLMGVLTNVSQCLFIHIIWFISDCASAELDQLYHQNALEYLVGVKYLLGCSSL